MSRLLTCTYSTRPLDPIIGDTWLETDTGSIIVYGPLGWKVYGLQNMGSASGTDTDGDGIDDEFDTDNTDGPLGDSDGDGVINQNDNFPNDPNRASGTDTDGDGIDDEFDTSYEVAITSSNGIVTGSGQQTVGSTVTLSATPDGGYQFKDWTVNSGGVTIVDNSFTMPANNVSITANYTATDYTVTVDGANGTETGGGTYNIGDTVTLSAAPDSGYTFDSWTVNSGGVVINNNSFTMPAGNVEVTANYTATDYTVTVNGTNGTQSASVTGGNFNVGETVTLSATPNTDYTFNNWTVDFGGVTLSDTTDPNTTFTMPANNVTITANYEATSTVITTAPFGGVVEYASDSTNTFITNQASGAQFTALHKDFRSVKLVTSYIINNLYYQGFACTIKVQWSNTNADDSWQDIASHFIDNTKGNFAPSNLNVYCRYIRIQVVAFGSNRAISLLNWLVGYHSGYVVTFDGVHQVYNEGETVTISATPDDGYTFLNWATASPGVTFADSSSSPTSFTMPANNVSITANYTFTGFTVTVDGAYGTEGGDGTYDEGQTVILTATPDAGYDFIDWEVNSELQNTGSIITDSSFNGNRMVSPANQSIALVDGVNVNSKAVTVGSNNYLACDNITINNFSNSNGDDLPFSVSAWVKLSGNVTQRMVTFGKYNWIFGTDAYGRLSLTLWSGGSNTSFIQKNSAPLSSGKFNVWGHVVATYDGSKTAQGIQLYQDGLLWTNVTLSNSGNYQGLYQQSPESNQLRIGSWALNNSTASGAIDDVLIFDYALTHDDVLSLYNNGIGPTNDASTLSPFGWWKMDDIKFILSSNSFTMPASNVTATANYTLLNSDTDIDGVVDGLDYFYNDEFETYTKDELDALTLDTTDDSVLAEWDIIKCLLTPDTSDQNNQGIVAGEYYLAVTDEGSGTWRVSGRDGNVLNSDDVTQRISLASRGTVWQRVIRQ